MKNMWRNIRTVVFALSTCTLLAVSLPPAASAQIAVSIRIGPPALPVYVQPVCPSDGYIWTPGYWAYGPYGYYWVPGVWVRPPRVGFLWTPGYWGFVNGAYLWHAGYWGPHVGFYGGINYGYGYSGVGFYGGRWDGAVFRYNTAITNVNTVVVRNVYVDRTVIRTTVVNRTSFNGPGGIMARPRSEDERAMREEHIGPTPNQVEHREAMSRDRNQLNAYNHGRPGVSAMDSVNGRRFNQQGRIANGISSGQLTPAETRNLENRQVHLNNEVRNDRAQNGGRLSPQERQQVNRQQNNMSRDIYNDKHNGAKAPRAERGNENKHPQNNDRERHDHRN